MTAGIFLTWLSYMFLSVLGIFSAGMAIIIVHEVWKNIKAKK